MWAEILMRLGAFLVILIVADVWSFRALRRTLFRRSSRRAAARWLIPGTTAVFLVYAVVTGWRNGMPGLDPERLRAYYSLATAFLLIYGPKLVLAFPALLEDILRLAMGAAISLFSRGPRYSPPLFRRRRRIPWLSWPALILSILLAAFLLEGTFIRRHRFITRELTLESTRVPVAFSGFRILQFSDAHLGSFSDTKDVITGLKRIQETRPDMILFTGDLVNSNYQEALPYLDWFRQLSAPRGKYAILGNHDLDDFMKWTEESTSREDIEGLVRFWEDAGFTLLRDTHLTIGISGDTLALAGVDNWGLPPFRQLGDLSKALKDIPAGVPVILMSHDPTHWKEEVLGKEDVFLTLSGHTHAMQFGLSIPGIGKWSPSSWKYPEWWGLYNAGGQHLYVNPGFGYIGFRLRAGIRPEITVIRLEPGKAQ